MKLIVNADDFGFSEGVNNGIVLAHKKGIVTSTTVMITMPAVDHALSLLKDAPNLKLGLHLNMTLGKPITNCFSLLKEDGNFYKPKENPDQTKFKKEEIKNEFLAQYDAFFQKFNKKPSHLDTHLYAHQLYEVVSEVIAEISREKDVPVRDLETEGYKRVGFIDWFKILHNEKKDDLINKVYNHNKDFIKNEVSELMVHPAIPDDYLMQTSTYNKQRIIELEVLIDEKMKQFILNNKIELTSFEEVSICRR